MADDYRDRTRMDRYRSEPGRYDRDRGGFGRDEDRRYGSREDYRDAGGMIARRGFGNEGAGYDRDRGSRDDRDHGRDYGGNDRYRYGGSSSGGYGTGGSAYDYRDVMAAGRSGEYPSRDEDYRGSFGSARRDTSYQGSSHRDDRDATGYRGERGFFERAGDEIASWFGDDDAERRRRQDARMGDEGASHHRGKGPKGYQRSDDRIRDDVNDRLTDDPYLDASEIDVSVSDREVTLTGTVNSRADKRRAEDLAEAISGVTHVQNNLRVQQASAMTTAGASGSSGMFGSGTNTTGSGGGLTGTGLSSGSGESSSTTSSSTGSRYGSIT